MDKHIITQIDLYTDWATARLDGTGQWAHGPAVQFTRIDYSTIHASTRMYVNPTPASIRRLCQAINSQKTGRVNVYAKGWGWYHV